MLMQNNSNYLYVSLKERIDIVLKEQGETLKSLSDRLNMKYTTVRMQIVRNSMSGKDLQKIAQIYNISRKWLETGKGEMVVAVDAVAEPAATYENAYAAETGVRLLRMINAYVPADMQDVVKKMEAELVDLYEYKELYFKAKEAFRPK